MIKIQTDCNTLPNDRHFLVEENVRLAANLVRKFCRSGKGENRHRDEYYSAAYLCLCECAMKYNKGILGINGDSLPFAAYFSFRCKLAMITERSRIRTNGFTKIFRKIRRGDYVPHLAIRRLTEDDLGVEEEMFMDIRDEYEYVKKFLKENNSKWADAIIMVLEGHRPSEVSKKLFGSNRRRFWIKQLTDHVIADYRKLHDLNTL